MKVYIESTKDYEPCNYNFFCAYQGYREMGFETVKFHDFSELKKSAKEDIVVGYVDTVRRRMADFGICTPEIDYPDELKSYLGRNIWRTKLSRVTDFPEKWPVFVKPVEDKKFAGVLVRSPSDLIGCGTYGEDPEVYCSDPVAFLRRVAVFCALWKNYRCASV